MEKSGSDTAFPFRLGLGGSLRREQSSRHRSGPLKQGARKSACGMSGHIEEGRGEGKGRLSGKDAANPRNGLGSL